jgi:hypothetical protein
MPSELPLVKSKAPFIQIENGSIKFSYRLYLREVEDGYYEGSIPSYDIYFSAKNKEAAISRAKAAMQAFYAFWIQNQGWTAFIMQINRLGFRSKLHQFDMQSLLKNRPTKVKLNFNPTTVNSYLEEGAGAEQIESIDRIFA